MNREWENYFETSDLRLVRNKFSGLVKTNFVDKKIKRNANWVYGDKEEAKKQLEERNKFTRFAREFLGNLPIIGPGKFLDIGCGAGWIVEEANRRGFEAKGIDMAKEYVSIGKQYFGLDLSVKKFEKTNFKGKFRVIVANHVLEHVDNLDVFLGKVRGLLVNGGYFLVACPNIDSLMFRVFKRRWYGLVPGQHKWHFTGKSLASVLEKNGFQVAKVRCNSLDYRPGGWKGIVFWMAMKITTFLNIGDQVIVLAKKI